MNAPLLLFSLLATLANLPARGNPVDPELATLVRRTPPDSMVEVIIELPTQADLSAATELEGHARSSRVERSLRSHAKSRQAGLIAYLRKHGARDIKPLWINNSIAAKIPARLVSRLAKRREVARIRGDAAIAIPHDPSPATLPPVPNAVHPAPPGALPAER